MKPSKKNRPSMSIHNVNAPMERIGIDILDPRQYLIKETNIFSVSDIILSFLLPPVSKIENFKILNYLTSICISLVNEFFATSICYHLILIILTMMKNKQRALIYYQQSIKSNIFTK